MGRTKLGLRRWLKVNRTLLQLLTLQLHSVSKHSFAHLMHIVLGHERHSRKLWTGQFQGLFRPGYGLSREDEHDLHRIWEALRKTLRSPILEAYQLRV